MATPQISYPSLKTSDFRLIASGFNYPEGPIYRPDGTLLLVEIGAGTLTRVQPDGSKSTVANLPGGPNGAAIGPDGAVYICNDGGFFIATIGNVQVCLGQPPNYKGGSIQRVAANGAVSTLYTQFPAQDPLGNLQTLPLRSPDDLVFDSSGSFWFTDWGKDRWRDRDITGVYYAKPDGSSIQEMIFPLKSPNGIGLSPDETRLYVAESFTRRILYWELSGPGQIRPNPKTIDGSYLLTAHIPFQACLDSLALDEAGNIYVASFLPHGADPNSRGGITVISPQGEILEWIEIGIGQPEPLPSNLCFGGTDRRTLFVTLGGTGCLVACQVRIPGKKLAFQ
jgi:gluconolactonase